MLRVASVGLGWWGRELAAAAQKAPQALQIVSCFSPDRAECERFAGQFRAKPAASFEDVLEDATIDAVLLATPHSLHASQIECAVTAGKHVFVEKPFTLTHGSGLAAAQAAKSHGRVLAIGHNRRFSAVAQMLKQMASDAKFGRILHLEGNYSFNSAMLYAPGIWRADRNEAKGGALASLGLHVLDIMTWLVGPVQRVSGLTRRVAVPVDIDDVAVALMEFRNGITGTVSSLFSSPLVTHLRISGTECVAEVTDDFNRLSIQWRDGKREDIWPAAVDTVKAELEQFAGACLRGEPLLVTTAEAIHNVAVMDAIVESGSVKGQWTTVEG